MTNDSHLFRTREELEEQEGAWPIGDNRFDSAAGSVGAAVRGKDGAGIRSPRRQHRHQPERIVHRPAQTPNHATAGTAPRLPTGFPVSQYWVKRSHGRADGMRGLMLGTRLSRKSRRRLNVRTFIAALLPAVGFKDVRCRFCDRKPWQTDPHREPANPYSGMGIHVRSARRSGFAAERGLTGFLSLECARNAREWLIGCPNLNATILSTYVTRQKVQGQHSEPGSSSSNSLSFRPSATNASASVRRPPPKSCVKPYWSSRTPPTTWPPLLGTSATWTNPA